MRKGKDSQKGRDLKAKGDKAYAQQKWKKALAFYEDAAQHFSNDARLEQRMGDLFRRLKKDQQAIDQYKRAADLYSSDGFWAKAIAINKLIMEIDPDDHEVHRKLAEMYAAQKTESESQNEIVPEVTRPEAISIAGAEPLTMESKITDDAFLGNTVSISGAEPKSMDDDEIIDLPSESEMQEEGSSLGPPYSNLQSIPLFSDMGAEELFAVFERLAIRRFPENTLVCEEGDVGRSMYVIAEGWLEVFIKDADGSPMVLSRLRGGDFFGEFGLLTNGVRNASVQAKTDVEVLEITSKDFDFIEAQYPGIWLILEDYLKRRMMDTILRKSPVFRALNDTEREQLGKSVKLKKFAMGDVITEEGTPGAEMYFVKSGSLTVMVQKGQDRVVVGELHPGEYFGEVAMLSGRNRTASVHAKTECELFELTRSDAAKVLRENKEILTRLKGKMDERAQETRAVAMSYEEAKKTLAMV